MRAAHSLPLNMCYDLMRLAEKFKAQNKNFSFNYIFPNTSTKGTIKIILFKKK